MAGIHQRRKEDHFYSFSYYLQQSDIDFFHNLPGKQTTRSKSILKQLNTINLTGKYCIAIIAKLLQAKL